MAEDDRGPMVSAGLGALGAAISPQADQGKALAQYGQQIGQILQNRFFQSQAEDFAANELAKFQQANVEFQNSIEKIKDGDEMAAATQGWYQNTIQPFMTTTAIKYGRNPIIMSAVQNIDKSFREGMDMWANLQKTGAEQELSGARAEQARASAGAQEATADLQRGRLEMLPQEKEKIGAEIGATRALTEQRKATAARQREETRLLGQPKAEDLSDAFLIPPGTSPEETLARARNLERISPKVVQKLDEEVMVTLANNYIQERRGMPRPDGGVWGGAPTGALTTPKDIEDAKAAERGLALQQIRRRMRGEEWQKLLNANRIAKIKGPEYLDLYGNYFDQQKQMLGNMKVELPESGMELTGNEDSRQIVQALTAASGQTLNELQITGPEDFIQLMNETRTLAEVPSPTIQTVINESATVDEYGNLIATDGSRIRNYEELQLEMLNQAKLRILESFQKDEKYYSLMRKAQEALDKNNIKKANEMQQQAVKYILSKPAAKEYMKIMTAAIGRFAPQKAKDALGTDPQRLRMFGLPEEEPSLLGRYATKKAEQVKGLLKDIGILD